MGPSRNLGFGSNLPWQAMVTEKPFDP